MDELLAQRVTALARVLELNSQRRIEAVFFIRKEQLSILEHIQGELKSVVEKVSIVCDGGGDYRSTVNDRYRALFPNPWAGLA